MHAPIIGAGLTVAGLAALVTPLPSVAAAPARASVTVTITAEGVDMSGTVRSTRPARCAADRTVKLFKLVRGEPHLFATDTTEREGDQFVWSTGNTGTEGRFFAKVAPKPGCKGDVSPVIRVRRED